MNNEKIELDEWRKLYEAAGRFKQTECWEWISDIDIIGVENIDTHEIGYCCVMGNAGQVFGLSIYVGDRGLKSFMDTLYPNMPLEDIGYIQDCITLYFEDREKLDRDDLNIIKQLGLKFRGRKQWPQFKNYTPNYFPSQLSKSEVRYMTYALEQVIDVALRCREDKTLLNPKTEGQILVRVPKKVKGEIVWEDSYKEMALEDGNDEDENINEVALKRVKDSKPIKAGVWEVDFFNAPAMVKETGRPYYPLMFAIAEAESGVLLDMKMSSDFDGYIDEFRQEIINVFEQNKQIPEMIVVQRKKVYQMLEPISSKLGIELQPVEELYGIMDFREGLKEFL